VSESARAGASGAEPTRRPTPRPARGKEVRLNIFQRLARFLRQIAAELKKVIWPTRKDLVNYATAVLVFVAIVMAFVTLVDLGVGSLTGLIFG
jgi:preprotein translocase subunit SecE